MVEDACFCLWIMVEVYPHLYHILAVFRHGGDEAWLDDRRLEHVTPWQAIGDSLHQEQARCKAAVPSGHASLKR